MIEKQDYELIPGEDGNWNIRFLKGDYIESVMTFNVIKVVGEELHFDYSLISSPDDNLKEDDQDFQVVVQKVLLSILESAIGNQEE